MDSRGGCPYVCFASAEETDFRTPGNHRASDDNYDDHDNEFHISLIMLPSHQTASAQLTSSCREGKLRKCRWAIKVGNAEFVKRFSKQDSQGNFDIGVGKHLGGESLDGSGLAPGIQRQTSFAAGLLQKSFPVPTVFDGNLGQ